MRRVLVGALVIIAVASGCLGSEPATKTGGPASTVTDTTPTPVPAGTIKVYAVDQVPEDALVLERDGPRIRDVEQLQSAIDDALGDYGRVNRSTLASVRVEGENLTRVREALNSTPSYHDLPGHAPGWADLFVRTDETVFAVQLWVEV